MNHFAQMCRNSENYNRKSTRNQRVYSLTINDVSTKLRNKQGKKSPKVRVTVTHNNKKVQIPATPDTGAEISVIPPYEAERLGVNINNL